MLQEQDKVEIKKRLDEMAEPVKLAFFTQQLAGTCQFCSETEQLLKEVAALSEKLTLEIYNFVTDKEEKRPILWELVTRVNSPVGWKLDDLAMRLGVMDKLATYNRGVPSKMLWSLFAAADCFLLTSKTEGLAIPAMEAMAATAAVSFTIAAC